MMSIKDQWKVEVLLKMLSIVPNHPKIVVPVVVKATCPVNYYQNQRK
jgi:hypothetical protein